MTPITTKTGRLAGYHISATPRLEVGVKMVEGRTPTVVLRSAATPRHKLAEIERADAETFGPDLARALARGDWMQVLVDHERSRDA